MPSFYKKDVGSSHRRHPSVESTASSKNKLQALANLGDNHTAGLKAEFRLFFADIHFFYFCMAGNITI